MFRICRSFLRDVHLYTSRLDAGRRSSAFTALFLELNTGASLRHMICSRLDVVCTVQRARNGWYTDEDEGVASRRPVRRRGVVMVLCTLTGRHDVGWVRQSAFHAARNDHFTGGDRCERSTGEARGWARLGAVLAVAGSGGQVF